VAACAQIREDREVFSKVRASMVRRTQAFIIHQGQPFSAFTVNKVGTLKVKVLCTRTFFLHNSVSVSNFLRGNRFRFVFFLPFHFKFAISASANRLQMSWWFTA
jgi:hypothetical protein